MKTSSILIRILFVVSLAIVLFWIAWPTALIFAQSVILNVDGISGTVGPSDSCPSPRGGADYQTIQKAIDCAQAGDTIMVSSGVYTENLTVNVEVTLQGAGSGDTAADTIIGVVSGDGIDLRANNVTLQDFHLRGTSTPQSGSHGIFVNTFVSTTTLENVALTRHYRGMFINSAGGVDGLTIQNSRIFSNNYIGFESMVDILRTNNQNDLTNVQVSNTTFNENGYKGIYLEKLNQATFDNIEVVHSGLLCPQTYFNWPAGIDINLKYGDYQNITFSNSRVVNSGNADVDDSNCGGDAALDHRSVGMTIKARDVSYSPVTLSDVEISGVEISGNRTGLRFGEPDRNNAGPTSTTVHHTRIVSNTLYGVNNQTTAVITATNNWWGCNFGPDSTGVGCVVTTNAVTGSGTTDYEPWLLLGLSAAPNPVSVSGNSVVTASLTWNSVPEDTAGLGYLPDGIPVRFDAGSGSMSPLSTVTANGQATTTYTAGTSPGTVILSTTVDGQTITASLIIEDSSQEIFLPIIFKN